MRQILLFIIWIIFPNIAWNQTPPEIDGGVDFACRVCESGTNTLALIRYDERAYNDGEVIFINDFHNGQEVETSQNGGYQLVLDVLCDTEIQWTVTNSVGEDISSEIIESTFDKIVELKFKKAHYELLEVTATFLNQSITVKLLPLNLVISVSDEFDVNENIVSVPTNIPTIAFNIQNNHQLFGERPELFIEVMETGTVNFSRFTEDQNPTQYNYAHRNQCGSHTFEFRLVDSRRSGVASVIGKVEKSIYVQCPFALQNLIAKAPVQNPVAGDLEFRVAEAGKTLYLVRNMNQVIRSIDYELVTDATSIDFWENEPTWEFGEGNMIGNNGDENVRFEHNEFPITPPGEIQSQAKVSAFGTTKTLDLVFVNENRRELALSSGSIFSFLNGLIQKWTEACEKLNDPNSPLGGVIDYDCPNFVITGTEEFYNIEDKKSAYYIEVEEKKIGIGLSWAERVSIPVSVSTFFPKYFRDKVKVGYFIDFSLGAAGSYGKETQSRIDKTIKVDSKEFFELEGNGTVALGGELVFNPGEIVDINAELSAASSLAIKGELEVLPCPNSNQLSGIIEWDPLLINGTVSATLGGFELIDFNVVNYKLFDRFSGSIGPTPIGGKNCD